MEGYTDEWREFVLNLLDGLMGDADDGDTRSSLGQQFDVLYGNSNSWGLSVPEFLALILAVCTELFPRVEELISSSAISKAYNSNKLTYGFVLVCAGFLSDDPLEAGELVDENSILNRLFLCPDRATADYRLSTGIRLRSGMISYFLGNPIPLGDAFLCAGCVSAEELAEYSGDIIAHKREYDELFRLASSGISRSEDGIICLKGEKGAGKKFLAFNYAKETYGNLLVLDASKYLGLNEGERAAALDRILAKTVLDGYLIYIDCNDKDPGDPLYESDFARLITYIMGYTNLLLMGSVTGAGRLDSLADVYEIELGRLSDDEQKSFYEYFAGSYGAEFAEDINLREITSKYRLCPGKIGKAIKKCVMEKAADNDPDEIFPKPVTIDRKSLEEQIRSQCQARFDRLATRLTSSFTFDDLTVSDEARKKLDEIIARVVYRGTVLETFGFDKKLPYGRGLVIALYGPPGTGKTMAANVLANELGLDIYRIDLSQISSKYIGESEKNLGAVFDAAKDSNAVLFFDEADALFAKRTDVSSSNDKHSNSETAFLLQKMEEYDGISILATNVIQNFDSAFRRRITYMINIEKPSEAERLKLWQNVFPKGAPLADDVRLEVLADKADIPGSSIKAAAVAAAYRAAARGDAINHEDLAICTDEEYKKTGHTSILRDLMYG